MRAGYEEKLREKEGLCLPIRVDGGGVNKVVISQKYIEHTPLEEMEGLCSDLEIQAHPHLADWITLAGNVGNFLLCLLFPYYRTTAELNRTQPIVTDDVTW